MSAFVSKLFREMSHVLKKISHILKKISDILKKMSHVLKNISHVLKKMSHMWENKCHMWEDIKLFGNSALVRVCCKYSGGYKQREVFRPWLGDATWR